MARKARSNASTIARFIAPDDSAIGGDANTLGDRYEKYLNTADLRVLELNKDESPAYYFVRPFVSQERALLRDYFEALKTDDGAGEGETKLAQLENVDLEQFGLLRKTVLSNCIVGCVDHPMPDGEIGEDGSLTVRHVRWDVGAPEPAGLKASMLADELLVGTMLTFLFTISRLSEDEKN